MPKSRYLVLASVIVAACVSFSQMRGVEPAPGKESAPALNVEIAGATWLGSFDEAVERAMSEDKPVLHLQMFGKLDDAYC
jgi:hypothetical protein